MDLSGLGSVADFAKSIVDRIFPPSADPNEKLRAEAEIRRMIQERENALIEAKKAIIVSEMNQGDSYTKRARPTLVYAGLGFIFLVHVFIPLVAFFTGKQLPSLSLPSEFWLAWASTVGIWSLGRSAEKRGFSNKLTSLITGK